MTQLVKWANKDLHVCIGLINKEKKLVRQSFQFPKSDFIVEEATFIIC